jgi:NAD-dependent SIR2 family protein deacetylase
MLEHMVCSECGEVFDEDRFAEDPSETIVCPICGTVALDAQPVEDCILHIHMAATALAEPQAPRLSA